MTVSFPRLFRRERPADRKLLERTRSVQTAILRQADDAFDTVVEGIRDYAIFLMDRDGLIVSWNEGAERIKGYRREEILGRHFSIFYPEELAQRGAPADELAMAAAAGRYEDSGWRVRKDGVRFWANVVLTPLRDPEGNLRGFVKITRDLTEARQAEERLRFSEERFRLLIEGVRDYAIFMLDTDGRVVTWNIGAQRIHGYKPAEIIGRHFSTFYTSDAVEKGWPDHELRAAARDGRFEDEGWRVHKDGSRFWGNVIITAVRDASGTLQGFSKVTRDLTERRRAEESLEERVRERTAELTRLAEAQNTFLAMLSHELRNPLAPMRNALHLLEAPDVPPEVTSRASRIMGRQLEHLIRLVNDLLDVARIVQDRIELKQDEVNLTEALQRAVETARPAIDAQRHRLDLNLPAEPVPIRGDMVRLAQVFSNLLLNAAKYTEPEGKISVELERMDGHALVRVRDTGIGIEKEMLGRVFDLFSQARGTLDRSKGGLGIGLTLVRRIVEMHGGGVNVHSEGSGCGSEFTVSLPVMTGDLQGGLAASVERFVPNKAAAARRIVIVDDNQDAADSLAALLELCGHHVRVAYDGIGALTLVRVHAPEIVLLDIGLPGMDGYEVAARVRREASHDGIVLIAMTGYGQEEDKRRAREAGFDQHLTKPVDPQVLEAILAEM